MLNEDAFPGEIAIDPSPSRGDPRVAHQRLVADLGPKGATPEGLKRHLEQNPIEAWAGGKGTGGTPYFAYENGVFRTTFGTEPDDRAALQELARELATGASPSTSSASSASPRARPSYPARSPTRTGGRSSSSRTATRTRASPRAPPRGDRRTRYEADFVRVAVNVARLPGEDRNRLPEILRAWFGPDAGLPGTATRSCRRRPRRVGGYAPPPGPRAAFSFARQGRE